MSVLTIDCHDNALRGLKDPYTGVEQTFKMILGRGQPRVFSPNAFSPRTRYAKSQDAFLAIHARGGIVGALGDREVVRCPYTGEVMRMVNDGDGFFWDGGFDPTLPIYTAEVFMNLIRMRDGKLSEDRRVKPPRTTVTENNVDIPTDVDVNVKGPDENTEDLIRKLVDGPSKTKPTTVTMTTEAPKKRGRAKAGALK